MQKSSLRRNIVTVFLLYAISFAAASGCPSPRETDKPVVEPGVTPSSTPASTPENTSDAPAAGGAATAAPPSTDATSTPAPTAPGHHEQRPSGEESAATQEEDDVVATIASAYGKSGDHAADGSKPKFDPVKVNGEFFVGWKKPQLAILISGHQDGYMEPCGCAGLENQKGGLARRHTLIEQLKEKGWPLLAVDVGNLVRRYGKQAEVQFAMSAEALKTMGYAAVGFGPDDLRLSAGELAAAVAGQEAGESLFVSANASIFGLTPKLQIVEKNGLKVGITAVMGDTYRAEVNNAEIEFTPAAEALAEVVPQLADCQIKILLAQATQAECAALSKQFPQFDLVVSAEGGDEPPHLPESLPGGKAKLIEVGHKGMYCVVLGVYDDPKQPLRYQRVALDSRFTNSPAMKKIMATYQDQLHDLGWAGLGLRAVAHPRTKADLPESGKFVGAETCKDCHTKAWEVWSKSRHAHATDSLVSADPPRQFDAECISCHATGWNPQEYFPYATGYESLERTPHLTGNQCENCHGPGGAHVAVEMGESDADAEAMRAMMRLTLTEAKTGFCQKCHDLDNSPEFQKEGAFDHYWAEIEHIGKD